MKRKPMMLFDCSLSVTSLGPAKGWHKEVLINGGEMNMKGEARGYEYCSTTSPGGTSTTGTPQALGGAVAATLLGKITSILIGKVLS